MLKKKIFFRNIKFFLLIFIIALSFFVFEKIKAGSADNVSGWAWSENVGWISFNNITGGGPVDYGVNVDALTGDFSGYAWSENVGWISFEASDVSVVQHLLVKLILIRTQIMFLAGQKH